MRGKAEVRHERDQEPGITPACAGKRHCPRFRPGKTRDHPRVCGEKSSLMQMDVGPLGSPPRMRGKEKGRRTHKVKSGITPAYAGKSAYLSPEDTAGRDHPRVCGEKCSTTYYTMPVKGSPPRMRGKAAGRAVPPWAEGITPAYAGKRAAAAPEASGHQDHPRVCGEKFDNPKIDNSQLGSPPRVRGKV